MSKKTSNLKVCAEVQEEGVSHPSAPPQMEVRCSRMRGIGVEMSTRDPRTQTRPIKNPHTGSPRITLALLDSVYKVPSRFNHC